MNQTSALLGSPARRAGARPLAVLVLTLLAVLLSPVRADAAQYSNTAGRIGSVSLHGPMIIGSDYRTNGLYGTSIWWKAWEAGSYTVTRSPSSTALQTVIGVSEIQRWDGSWVTIQSRTYNGRVSGTGTLTFPSWTWTPTQQPWRRAGYRVVYHLAWRVTATNQLLAYTTVVPSTYADNRCRMLSLGCSQYTDGINF